MTMTMKDIIPPVPLNALREELSQDRFVRKTNKGGNQISKTSTQTFRKLCV